MKKHNNKWEHWPHITGETHFTDLAQASYESKKNKNSNHHLHWGNIRNQSSYNVLSKRSSFHKNYDTDKKKKNSEEKLSLVYPEVGRQRLQSSPRIQYV